MYKSSLTVTTPFDCKAVSRANLLYMLITIIKEFQTLSVLAAAPKQTDMRMKKSMEKTLIIGENMMKMSYRFQILEFQFSYQ